MKQKRKVFNIIVACAFISAAVTFLYPYANNFIVGLRDSSQFATRYYAYSAPSITPVDTSHMPPATAVPMLMYHGVTYKFTNENTTVKTFVKQMEILKREGYQTISIDEYNRFREGAFVLPPKPIIITFDDGRKDSYYTTDPILKELGFKATLFYASAPVIDGNGFYLNWDELQVLKNSGRWEIEAHGRDAHKHIPTDESGELKEGRFLISKMYVAGKNRIETDEEYSERVEQDYLNNISDLKQHLGITPQYFAIPLNDYGNLHDYNYKGASQVNLAMMKKYFKLAFIEVNNPTDVVDIKLPAYNFADENPYAIGRIEVKEMPPESLKLVLEREFPVEPHLSLEKSNFLDGQTPHYALGEESASENGYLLSSSKVGISAVASFGQRQWENYVVHTAYKKLAGDSVSLVAPYKNDENYVTCGVNKDEAFIRHFTPNSVDELSEPKKIVSSESDVHYIEMTIQGSIASCSIDGTMQFQNIILPLSKGAVGIKVLGKDEAGSVLVKSLTVVPLK